MQVSMSSLSCMLLTFFLSFLCEIRCHVSFWKAAPQKLHHWPPKIHCGRWLTSASDLSNHRSKPSASQLVGLIRGPPWRTNQVTSYWTLRNYAAFDRHTYISFSDVLEHMFEVYRFFSKHVSESVLGIKCFVFNYISHKSF